MKYTTNIGQQQRPSGADDEQDALELLCTLLSDSSRHNDHSEEAALCFDSITATWGAAAFLAHWEVAKAMLARLQQRRAEWSFHLVLTLVLRLARHWRIEYRDAVLRGTLDASAYTHAVADIWDAMLPVLAHHDAFHISLEILYETMPWVSPTTEEDACPHMDVLVSLLSFWSEQDGIDSTHDDALVSANGGCVYNLTPARLHTAIVTLSLDLLLHYHQMQVEPECIWGAFQDLLDGAGAGLEQLWATYFTPEQVDDGDEFTAMLAFCSRFRDQGGEVAQNKLLRRLLASQSHVECLESIQDLRFSCVAEADYARLSGRLLADVMTRFMSMSPATEDDCLVAIAVLHLMAKCIRKGNVPTSLVESLGAVLADVWLPFMQQLLEDRGQDDTALQVALWTFVEAWTSCAQAQDLTRVLQSPAFVACCSMVLSDALRAVDSALTQLNATIINLVTAQHGCHALTYRQIEEWIALSVCNVNALLAHPTRLSLRGAERDIDMDHAELAFVYASTLTNMASVIALTPPWGQQIVAVHDQGAIVVPGRQLGWSELWMVDGSLAWLDRLLQHRSPKLQAAGWTLVAALVLLDGSWQPLTEILPHLTSTAATIALDKATLATVRRAALQALCSCLTRPAELEEMVTAGLLQRLPELLDVSFDDTLYWCTVLEFLPSLSQACQDDVSRYQRTVSPDVWMRLFDLVVFATTCQRDSPWPIHAVSRAQMMTNILTFFGTAIAANADVIHPVADGLVSALCSLLHYVQANDGVSPLCRALLAALALTLPPLHHTCAVASLLAFAQTGEQITLALRLGMLDSVAEPLACLSAVLCLVASGYDYFGLRDLWDGTEAVEMAQQLLSILTMLPPCTSMAVVQIRVHCKTALAAVVRVWPSPHSSNVYATIVDMCSKSLQDVKGAEQECDFALLDSVLNTCGGASVSVHRLVQLLMDLLGQDTAMLSPCAHLLHRVALNCAGAATIPVVASAAEDPRRKTAAPLAHRLLQLSLKRPETAQILAPVLQPLVAQLEGRNAIAKSGLLGQVQSVLCAASKQRSLPAGTHALLYVLLSLAEHQDGAAHINKLDDIIAGLIDITLHCKDTEPSQHLALRVLRNLAWWKELKRRILTDERVVAALQQSLQSSRPASVAREALTLLWFLTARKSVAVDALKDKGLLAAVENVQCSDASSEKMKQAILFALSA
ncbi:hypothetical protein RI367_003496 [Sorochytrium milnesiophthora]